MVVLSLFQEYQGKRLECTVEMFGKSPSRLFLARPGGFNMAQRLVWSTSTSTMEMHKNANLKLFFEVSKLSVVFFFEQQGF